MKLQVLREKRNLTRKELSELSGISFRSLQDYEQGHKDIANAKGETLYRISIALGCTIEELIEENVLKNELNNEMKITSKQEVEEGRQKRLSQYMIESQRIYHENYKIAAKWRFIEGNCCLVFTYDSKIVSLPFSAVFTEKTLVWLIEIAIVKIENYIEQVELEKRFEHLGGDLWGE